jgi:NTE family protein
MGRCRAPGKDTILGVHVDVVAGTSMGAVVGGLYALGLSVDSIESGIAGAEWSARSWVQRHARPWSR